MILQHAQEGSNTLEVKSHGDRVAVVVQCVRERLVDELVEEIASREWALESGRSVLATEVGSGGNDDVVVTDMELSLKPSIGFVPLPRARWGDRRSRPPLQSGTARSNRSFSGAVPS